MKHNMIARLALASAVAVAIAVFGANSIAKDSSNKPMKTIKLPKYKNEDFYKDGKFQVDKAKQAYFDMMAAYGYPGAGIAAHQHVGDGLRPGRLRQCRHGRDLLDQLPGVRVISPMRSTCCPGR